MMKCSAKFTRVVARSLAAFLLFLAGSGSTWAHAVVIESSPQNGAALRRPPEHVILRFNAKVEKALTRATLIADDGRAIPLPTASRERSTDETPNRLLIPLPPLAPGAYVIHYKVLATDGHATQGALHFSVSGAH